ncbi:MAG: hypothetical protein ACU0E9_07425 [Limimaricola soesokkakensis]|uniref:hypothetical protein n=1 Tax=Limimaricola soesokkakensis TaxID=1343159 RepID=UPI004059EC11
MSDDFMKNSRWIGGLALAALLASGAAAAPYDGTYRLSRDADCTKIGEEGGALRIADGLFEGIDSECRMTRPVDVVDMDATLYTMECSAGDTRWSERALLMRAAEDDGLIMLWDGYAFRYERCTAEAQEAEQAAGTGAEIEAETEGGGDGLPPPRVALPVVELPRVELPKVEVPAVTALPGSAGGATAPRAGAPSSDEDEASPDEDGDEDEGGPDASGGASARAIGAGEPN